MSEYVIETEHLTKTFGTNMAVASLDLTVPRGSVFGFLGANGAGKTTTIRMLMGHLHPTRGDVRVLGTDPWEHTEQDRQRVAYVSESMELPTWMTPKQAMAFNAALYPRWNQQLAEQLLRDFGRDMNTRYRSLSKGQKRRTCLMIAICQNADLLILDEPAAGLDVSARHEMLSHLLDAVFDGERAVFISSHILSDLERIVDRIAFLHSGHLLLTGELDTLKEQVRQIRLPVRLSREAVKQYFQILRHESSEHQTIATLRDFDEARFRAFCEAHQCGGAAQVIGFNLEDLFVELQRTWKKPNIQFQPSQLLRPNEDSLINQVINRHSVATPRNLR